jgi:hypothetical protein
MRKIIGLAIAAGLLAGCQSSPDDYTVNPTLNPPTYAAGAPARTISVAKTTTVKEPAVPTVKTPAGNVPKTWIPQSPVRDWDYIVVHHSDTDVGGAKAFDNAHRQRGWDCLGYDFVIGNGTQTSDGQIEVGQRWTKQMVGAHAGVALYNEKGIGICLVGNFMETRPSQAQLQSLAKLSGYLMKTYRIAPDHVIGHRDAKNGRTQCPGKYMDLAVVRKMSAQYAAIETPHEQYAAADFEDLLSDAN